MDASERRRRVSQEAAEWWARLQDEDVTRKDCEQFIDWLRESSVHVAEMLRVAQVHGALEQFERWARLSTDGARDEENIIPFNDGRRPPPSPPTTRRFWVGAIAATVAAVAVAVGVVMTLRSQTIETERGERREVALSDGSVLEVDPETRMRVAFEDHIRRIVLERGRALFRVAKSPERPFMVQAAGTTVRAVGTAFGVERQTGGVVVTVAEGKVGISSPYAPPALPPLERTNSSDREGSGPNVTSPRLVPIKLTEVLLTAGQQVRLEETGTSQSVRTVDSARELAWARGRLVFDDDTVADAVAQFNRYNRVQLKVVDARLAAQRVNATFDASDPESFITFLQTVLPVKVTRTASEIMMQ